MRNPKYRKLWVVIALNLIFTFAWLKLNLALITFPLFLKIPVDSAINSLYILPGGWLKGGISAVIDAVVVWLVYNRKEVRKILGLIY